MIIASQYDNAISLCSRTDKMSDRKAVIKNADMSEEMQQDAVDCATQALEKYNIEKVYAHHTFMYTDIDNTL